MRSIVKAQGVRAERQMVVSFFYELADAEGRLVECSAVTETILLGYGQAAPSLESALLGLSVGESRSIVLQPKEAFGLHSPAAVLKVSRDEFPAEVAAGDEFGAQLDEIRRPTRSEIQRAEQRALASEPPPSDLLPLSSLRKRGRASPPRQAVRACAFP
jgi:FKBP-type peptidyl-prolyl cis-trans isomerase 2